ncbi:MAG: serine/threonine protein kinase [Anaerolineae bacterium]|nr:serine/threonine protein kinase [Anaerolineae bacterium]
MNASYAIITSDMFQIGDQIDRFQIQNHMAQGGMSNIYRAFDLVNRCEVVIKIPDQSMIGDPAQFERFQREMEVARQLNHPAVLRGLYAGQYNRIPYLVTEMVNGQSLRDLIEKSAPMTADQALPLVKKIAEGMAYCHQNNVIHRDLKPENILISETGQPVIMDFGLALTKSSHRVTYSNLSATMGTPDYMAPEQVEGQRGDARTDIYALGIMLFEMLSGRPPFSGDNNLVVMAQRLNGDAPRLDKRNPNVTPQVAAIVARCLQRDPNDRYADMPALIEALEHPETADTALLERLQGVSLKAPWWRSSAVRAILISLAILVAIVALALALQFFRQ